MRLIRRTKDRSFPFHHILTVFVPTTSTHLKSRRCHSARHCLPLLLLIGLLAACSTLAPTSSSPRLVPSPTRELKGKVSVFPLPTSMAIPGSITAGPDGNLWFTETINGQASPGGQIVQIGKIGRITPTGTVTEFPLPASTTIPGSITAGPDDNLWFTEMVSGPAGPGGKIGRITPTGSVTEFPLPTSLATLDSITAGPDGNLWFTEFVGVSVIPGGKVGRITPTGSVTEFPLPTSTATHGSITAGPDGNLWFTETDPRGAGPNVTIGRITPTGTVTEFPLPASTTGLGSITAGPDGNLWFTEMVSGPASPGGQIVQIGRITPTGTVTEFPLPASTTIPGSITAGPDGNLWFTEMAGPGGTIGRITPTGIISEFALPGQSSTPSSITRGPDGTLWCTVIINYENGQIDHLT